MGMACFNCAELHLLCSTSSTFLSGSLGAVSLTGSGVSNFYLQGQAASLALDLSGVSNAASAIDSGKRLSLHRLQKSNFKDWTVGLTGIHSYHIWHLQ